METQKQKTKPVAPPIAHWHPNQIIEIDQVNLRLAVEAICKQCRFPLLALRILLHVLTEIDSNGKVHISARHLAKAFDVHYDTTTKTLKFLREIGILNIER